MRRSERSSSAPSRNGVTSGSQSPPMRKSIVLLLVAMPVERANKNPVRNRRGPDLPSLRLAANARRKIRCSPTLRIFWISACGGREPWQIIGPDYFKVNESRVAIHAAETSPHYAAQCPASEVRNPLQQPQTRTSEAKGHWQVYDSS